MICVEGPDGAGKTTLVHHLADKYGLEIGKRGVTNRDFLYKVTRQDTYRAMAGAVQGIAPPVIWDRLWLSEYVYHDISPGRPCEFNPYETNFIHCVMDAIACPFILCLPSFEVVKANSTKVHQMEGVNDGLEHIYRAYASTDLPWPANTIRYDYTGQSSDSANLGDIYEEIEQYMIFRTHRQAPPIEEVVPS